MIAKHTGRTLEQVRKDIERDKILTAEEAMEYGLIDQVLTPQAEPGVLTRHRVPDAERSARRRRWFGGAHGAPRRRVRNHLEARGTVEDRRDPVSRRGPD